MWLCNALQEARMILGKCIHIDDSIEERTSFFLPFALLNKSCSTIGVFCNSATAAKKKNAVRLLSLWRQTASVIILSAQYFFFPPIYAHLLSDPCLVGFLSPLAVRGEVHSVGRWTMDGAPAGDGLFGVPPTVGSDNRISEVIDPVLRTVRSLEVLTPVLLTPQDPSRFDAIAISPITRSRRWHLSATPSFCPRPLQFG